MTTVLGTGTSKENDSRLCALEDNACMSVTMSNATEGLIRKRTLWDQLTKSMSIILRQLEIKEKIKTDICASKQQRACLFRNDEAPLRGRSRSRCRRKKMSES